jgi:hypothetical protein
MPDEDNARLALRTADQLRTDIANLECGQKFLMQQINRPADRTGSVAGGNADSARRRRARDRRDRGFLALLSGKRYLTLALITAAVAVIDPASAKEHRSRAVAREFQQQHPCPSTGQTSGACPGYAKDHIVPLACGGADAVANMQWQTTTDAKAKDKWETKGCAR